MGIPAKKLALASIGFIALLLFALPPLLRPANFPADDAYFYLQTAQNLARGYGSTFNRITTTNGYHPLWLLVLSGASFPAGDDKLLAIRLSFGLQILLSLVAAWLALLIARACSIRGYWLVGLPILAAYLLTGLFGSEAHLNAVATLATCYAFLRAREKPSRRRFAATGALAGAAVLARLDNVIVFASLVALLVVSCPSSRGRFPWGAPGVLASVLIPFAWVIAPYLAINLALWGQLLPVTVALKASFTAPRFEPAYLGLVGQLVALVGLAGIALSIAEPAGPRRALIRGLGLGVVLHASAITVFSTGLWTHWSWYYVPGVLNASFVLTVAAGRVARRLSFRGDRRIGPVAVAALGVALLAAGVGRGWARYYDPDLAAPVPRAPSLARGSQYRWPIALGLWLKEGLPAGSRILVSDGAGMIAWYSDLPVLSADGLVGDYQYDRDLSALGAESYLRSRNVAYYAGPIDAGTSGSSQLTLYAPLSGRPAGTVSLSDQQLVARVRDVLPNPEAGNWGVWKLRD